MEAARMMHLSVIITILCLFVNLANALDTISSSQPLTQNQTIVSSGQVFELGFFSPGNLNKWFIGIWYSKIPTKTVVWIANRDNPLSSSSGTLKIDKNRKLILIDESGKNIWQSKQTSSSSNTIAQILDNGNFVMRRENDNDPRNYLWQSFDYPTETLLPGMKVGDVFELGFFSPGNSNKWFVGIWYNKIPTKTVVWIPNRDNPLSSSSGTLKIDKNRKLILIDESGKNNWQSKQTSSSSNTVAQILDNGNFVVRRENDNDPRNYLWQSFDYQTETLLPGIKLGDEGKGQENPDSRIDRILEHLKRFLEAWDLRIVIIVSLFLQIILIFLAPLRKRVSSVFLSLPMWLAYLLADITATYALGIIAKSQAHEAIGPYAEPNLLALWAPFLLVHLGGPDTITAFALEDNELWLRHLLNLLFHGWAVYYSFIRAFPDRKLWLPTFLMILAGLIKYVERTRSLYLASTRRFRSSLLTEPDPGPNYAKLMDEYSSKKAAKLPTKIEMVPEPKRVKTTAHEVKILSDLEIVRNAHDFFDKFKGLIADLIFSFRERTESRGFFLQRTSRDAFKVVEVELNFIYEILYTKVVVVQRTTGYVLRFVSIGLTCASLVLFVLFHKHKIEKFDIGVTYTLLIGAITLDAVAFIMALTSDWTAVMLTKNDNILFRFLGMILHVGRERWPDKKQKTSNSFLSYIVSFVAKYSGFKTYREIIRRRWSESISQYNLLHYCLNPRPKLLDKFIGWFGFTNMVDSAQYVNTKIIDDEIRKLIFDELKMKAEVADDLETSKEINSARGDWVLRLNGCYDLLPWINDVDYDESLLLWHIATDLCYSETKVKNEPTNVCTYRRFAKILSDHMLYLLMMQSTMMSTVAGIGQIRFRDTCAEAKKFFKWRGINKKEKEEHKHYENKEMNDEELDKIHVEACKSLLDVHTAVKPVAVKGDRSKSVLFDACMLAKELNKLREEEKWEIMSKVWVELLCYAASRCRATTHAAQLSKGGQFITLVWLLMAHFGLGDQFQISEGHARAKLIVGK